MQQKISEDQVFQKKHSKAGALKLDQETWLFRTHDLQDKIWTILDNSRSYYTILDQFGPVWIMLYHLTPTLTIWDSFEQFWAILFSFRPFWTVLKPGWDCLDLF